MKSTAIKQIAVGCGFRYTLQKHKDGQHYQKYFQQPPHHR